MLTKSCPVSVKEVGDESGVFEALVSVFDVKDSYGDVVVYGAFTKTLSEWEASGSPIPCYWSHRMDDPDYNIGHVVDAREVPASAQSKGGLWVKVQLDLSSSKAQQVHRLLKGRRVTQFSFAYDIIDAAAATSEELGEYLELRQLQLYEVGPTPIGANQETELLTVKSAAARLAAEAKAGRVISTKNEGELRAAHEAIGRVLAALDTDDQEKAAPVKDEDHAMVKSKEPAFDTVTLLELEMSLS